MTRLLLPRLASSLLLLWLVVTLTFVAIQVAPGDPTTTILDARASRAQADALRSHLGLDRSIATQYGVWLKRSLQGDLGLSFIYQRSTASVIKDHVSATVLLGGFASLLGATVGMLLGALSARKKASWLSGLGHTFGIALYASPPFWLGLMMVLLFGGGVFHWFPSGGMLSPAAAADASPWQVQNWLTLLHHLILPGTVLATPLAVQVARLVRFDLKEQLEQEYITAARALGLSEPRLTAMALRNCMGPVIQVIGLWMPVLVGGAVVVEQVFSWPGLGSVAVAAISGRDYPLVLALTLLSATAVVLANLLADLVTAIIDPRTARAVSLSGATDA